MTPMTKPRQRCMVSVSLGSVRRRTVSRKLGTGHIECTHVDGYCMSSSWVAAKSSLGDAASSLGDANRGAQLGVTDAPSGVSPDLRAVLNDTGEAFLSWCDDQGLLHTLPGTITSPLPYRRVSSLTPALSRVHWVGEGFCFQAHTQRGDPRDPRLLVSRVALVGNKLASSRHLEAPAMART